MNREELALGISAVLALKQVDLARIEEPQPGMYRVARRQQIGGAYGDEISRASGYELFTAEEIRNALGKLREK